MFREVSGNNPPWARSLSDQQYELLRGELLELSNGIIDINNCDESGALHLEKRTANVANLARVCSELPEEDWGDELRRWVRVFGTKNQTVVPQYPKDIRMLNLQLYPAGYFKEEGDYLAREDIPGVLATVVIDEPDKLVAATKDYLKEWAANADKTYELLLDRLKEETPHTVEFIELAGNGRELVAALLGNEVTTANHALVLDTLYPQLIGKYGALVGLPHRHILLVKRLDAQPDAGLVKQFRSMVQFMACDRQDVISENVFQFGKGAYKKVA